MKEIGGYFELELSRRGEYHNNAIRLNTGRNALEFIIESRKYSKVNLPYYTCDAILEPLKKLSINYSFYAIDKNFEPIFNFNQMNKNEAFLYTNYFGTKDKYINELRSISQNLIIDNSQSFFSKTTQGWDTFYSCRKFFGVPDGAYLYMEGVDHSKLPRDISIDRVMHLTKRIDLGAETGYEDFKNNDDKLIGLPIRQMSNLTKRLLNNIDYEHVKVRRMENYYILNKNLKKLNKLKIVIEKNTIPMVYPFLSDNWNLREKLIQNKIFVATYWPNVLKLTSQESIEYKYASNLIPLPIDQRYGRKEMEQILKVIN